ncbi:Asp-tRNA(Asn)/Glu-tRNA(Gln) amidotransferase subunit GatB [Treponema sp. OMZ 803]|uniref:Asp-tRNA(Asn)/Glu-tRNA(Gln) amidotransferase subunit GatB n=1 Tax=Treponema sp. OMZ 803 TaxID=120682 RepID=UPI0020A3D2C5|nr:Asp-tRNA(Asn)/Glu-tRNA(Gln) amidotransferase subunit GatB [Treponema sp. OMZ 803]UTC52197.1 Asp-tRNA(Asn)/Glu-tRNA(Gln) amidotransferase subunit GatB [Treponema sp. OMZ 803]
MSSELSYEVIIGCEIHCQLLTKTKAFCSCENRYGGMPNSRVCPVCLGLPGALPVVGDEYVKLGIKAGFALGCTINEFSKFDRKHYFYPDLVKGYQITQFDKPICENGQVEINMAAPNEPPEMRTIRIERIHLEEDAGKSLHIEGAHSYVDYNRCGVPLIEIVSKPDMKSPEEAAQYMQTIREILKFIGVTDGNLEEGAMRCDANINLKVFENGKEYRTPISEIKNMNSFRTVRDACAYEVQRQLEEFKTDRQEYSADFKRTMGWDEPSGKTVIQRTKNSALDYRFMREPDIPSLMLSRGYIDSVCKTVGELPAAKRERFKKEYGLSQFDVETLTTERNLAEWFEAAAAQTKDPKKVANWVLAEVLAVLNEKHIGLEQLPFDPDHIAELVNELDAQTITSKQAKDVFVEMLESGEHPRQIIKNRGMTQVSDTGTIEKLVDEVFAANPQAIADWKKGKTNVAGWLMGQVMKKSQGKANPNQTTELVRKKLAAL